VDKIRPAFLRRHQEPNFRQKLKNSTDRVRKEKRGTCWRRAGGSKPKQEEMNTFPNLPFSFLGRSLCPPGFKFDPDKDAFLLLPDPITPLLSLSLINLISFQPPFQTSPKILPSLFSFFENLTAAVKCSLPFSCFAQLALPRTDAIVQCRLCRWFFSHLR
jgi:hypothetical protein